MKKEEKNIDMTNSNFYTIIAINTGYSTFNNNNFHTIGNVEIGEASGSLINRDVTNEIFAHEVLRHFYTFIQVAMNPNDKIADFHFLNSQNYRILYHKIEVNDVLKVKDKKGLFDGNEIKK